MLSISIRTRYKALKDGDLSHRIWLFEEETIKDVESAYRAVKRGKEPKPWKIDKEFWNLRDLYELHPQGKNPEFWYEMLTVLKTRKGQEPYKGGPVPRNVYHELIRRERANDILQASQSLENLFKVTRGRGEYGEFQLEQILKDILPSQYVHIRKRIPQTGKIPDAHIITPQGTLCIDSKFPLENYRKMLETTDETQKTKFSANFRNDVEGHIEKIKTDYVKPEEGTTPFAFGFIPSEAVYQYLTECEMTQSPKPQHKAYY